MMACTSPLLTLRLMPFKISLPSTEACRFLISNTNLLRKFGNRSQGSGAGNCFYPDSRPPTPDSRFSAHRAFQFQSQQARRFDCKLHRKLQEDVFTKTVDDE